MATVILPAEVVRTLLEYATDGVVHWHGDPYGTDGLIMMCDMCGGTDEHLPGCAIDIAQTAIRGIA